MADDSSIEIGAPRPAPPADAAGAYLGADAAGSRLLLLVLVILCTVVLALATQFDRSVVRTIGEAVERDHTIAP